MFSQEKFRQKIRDYLLFLISSGTDKKDIQKNVSGPNVGWQDFYLDMKFLTSSFQSP